jgi:cytochrome c-type biogenesis protein
VSQLLEAFVLGNAAILGNVCMLPLYPGLMAFLASNTDNPRGARARPWLGALVLAGVLSMMLLVGLLVFVLQQSFGAILPLLLPAIYIAVIALGLLMLFGRNPFNRISTSQIPLLRNPVAAAYAYGLLLGPMTLPCTGPLIVTAFVLGTGSIGLLADALLYFLAFGLGFGWPLIVLPWITGAAQKRFTGWFTRNHALIARLSGVLLIAIGVFGFVTEVLPNT